MGGAFFPLDERWGVQASVYSPERAKQMVWLASHMAFAAASEAFVRIARRAVPLNAVWDETQRHGERLKRYRDRQQAVVGVERVVLPPPGTDHDRPLGVSLDGGKMNIRGEGWKEFKAGAVFDVVATPEQDAQTGEWVDQVHGVNMTYRAVLGSVDEFAPCLWALSVERQVPQAADVAVVADGADWIWNLADDLFRTRSRLLIGTMLPSMSPLRPKPSIPTTRQRPPAGSKRAALTCSWAKPTG